MTTLLLFLLLATPAKPTALSLVQSYAKDHHAKLSIEKRGDYYWIEMSGSDVFGIGKTVESAARDFLADADIVAHEKQPNDLLHGATAGPDGNVPIESEAWRDSFATFDSLIDACNTEARFLRGESIAEIARRCKYKRSDVESILRRVLRWEISQTKGDGPCR